jgi:hypothetical protein
MLCSLYLKNELDHGTMQVDHTAQVDAKGPKTRTIADLLRAFKDDPTSNYCRAKYGTR